MLIVETIAKIRRAYHRDKKPIRQIARDMNLSRELGTSKNGCPDWVSR
jgi:hypothetical protein